MLRPVVVLLALLSSLSLAPNPAQAQSGGWSFFWGDDDDEPKKKRKPAASRSMYQGQSTQGVGQVSGGKPRRQAASPYYAGDDDDYAPQKPLGPKLLEGGPRPAISPIPPKAVPNRTGQAAGTVVIDSKGRQLFLVTSADTALRYPISVGREGFSWTGTEKISRIGDWPDWHPPLEMRERDPKLPEKMLGGIKNPLGAKSLYLGNSLYRIHGTNDGRSIGQAASSGCFRMLNGHVVDLAGRVAVGTKVVVVPYLGAKVADTPAPKITEGALKAKARALASSSPRF